MAGARRRTPLLRRLVRLTGRAVAALALATLAVILAFRWIEPPYSQIMASERARLGEIARDPVPLEAVSPHLVRAVMAAEDARFCSHWGLDLDAIGRALATESGGASTISQQVVKNVFLTADRSWIRKGVEAVLTPVVELAWGKRRIMEVYLNIAETGAGVFGAEAAARHWFGKPASELTLRQSARIAMILPAPRSRDPNRPGAAQTRRIAAIMDGAETIRLKGDDGCVLGD